MRNIFGIFKTHIHILILSILASCIYVNSYGVQPKPDKKNRYTKQQGVPNLKNIAHKAKISAHIGLGALTAFNGVLLATGLYSLMHKLREIKQSKISKTTFILTKYFCKYCTNLYPLETCIIPTTIATLSISSACSFYTSYKIFTYAYQAIKKDIKKSDTPDNSEKNQTN